MQVKFIFTFFLLGVCLTQNINAHPLTAEERGWIEDAYEYALQKIGELQKTITDVFNKARDTLNDYVEIINKQINDAIESVTNKLGGIITEAINKIEEIRKQAEQAGVNISECIDTDQLTNLLNSLINNEKTCVTSEVDKVYTMIADTMEIIDTTTAIAGALPAKVEVCMQNSGTLWCLKDVATEASGLLKIPGQVVSKVSEVTKFVTGLKVRLEYCASLQVVKAGKDSLEIVGEVAKCSACKIAPDACTY